MKNAQTIKSLLTVNFAPKFDAKAYAKRTRENRQRIEVARGIEQLVRANEARRIR